MKLGRGRGGEVFNPAPLHPIILPIELR